jgi:hypothetical protein
MVAGDLRDDNLLGLVGAFDYQRNLSGEIQLADAGHTRFNRRGLFLIDAAIANQRIGTSYDRQNQRRSRRD